MSDEAREACWASVDWLERCEEVFVDRVAAACDAGERALGINIGIGTAAGFMADPLLYVNRKLESNTKEVHWKRLTPDEGPPFDGGDGYWRAVPSQRS